MALYTGQDAGDVRNVGDVTLRAADRVEGREKRKREEGRMYEAATTNPLFRFQRIPSTQHLRVSRTTKLHTNDLHSYGLTIFTETRKQGGIFDKW